MNRTLIIAEAGVNHNGDIDIAKSLIDKACLSGADYVKFQTFKAKSVTSKFAEKADYQKKATLSDESQLDMVSKLALSYDDFKNLKTHCNKGNIKFLSTPFDLESIDFLNNIGLDVWKIPSGEITNLPYLIAIAQTKKPAILSTGMSTLKEVEQAINILKQNGTPKITLLHCTTEYPAPFEDVNLRAMLTLKEAFGLPVGYSDHTQGIEVSVAAVALGAVIIEKHFTLDKNMEGPDHKASLEPHELKAMVDAIRNTEKAMGNGVKEPAASEIKNITIARKSIVAKSDIKAGEIFSAANITVKRPGNGISPLRWFEVMGKKAVKDFLEDELIEL